MSHMGSALTTDGAGMVVEHGDGLPSRAEGEPAVDTQNDSFNFDDTWKDGGTDSESDEEPCLAKDDLERIQHDVRKRDRHKLLDSDLRNVIILGRTRTGKSTCVNVLKDVTFEPPIPTLFSETKDANFKSFSLKYHDGKKGSIPKNFTINIVDTPGLFEVSRASEGKERNNTFIKKCIRKCLENEIAKIHCVLIFLTVDGGINDKDVEAIEIFLEDFGSSKVTACLCITHAEGFDKHRKATVVEELKDYPKASKLIKQHNVKIIFTGCVRPNNYSDRRALTTAYNKVFKMRKKLLNAIFEADPAGAQLSSLKAIRKSNEATLDLANQCRNFLVSMTEKKHDMNLAELKIQLTTHSDNMFKLAEDEPILSRDLAITPVVKEIEKLLKKAADMYDPETVSKLSAPFSYPGGPQASSKDAQHSSSGAKPESKAQAGGEKAAAAAAAASSSSSAAAAGPSASASSSSASSASS